MMILKLIFEYSNHMQDFYKNIDEYNLDEDNKNLIVFEDVIADMINRES